MILKEICTEVCLLARETGSFIRNEQQKIKGEHIEIKGINDFVTYVDKSSEEFIVKRLQKLIPESGFITEENTISRQGNEFQWIIDPLDGTTNYIHGCPPYAISIALRKSEKIVLGVVYEICLDECYYASDNEPAIKNGSIISVSKNKFIQDSLVATGFPYSDYSKMDKYLKVLEYFMKNSHGLRRLGSAATDLAYVASGRYDAFYEYGLNPWDVAAGAFILKQAGGISGDFKGEDDWLFGKEIIASNEVLFPELCHIIKSIMK